MFDPLKDKLIVALDVPAVDGARELVAKLGDTVSFYKIGLELVLAGGLVLARDLKKNNKRVFLDMKLLDIGNTVERAVATVADLGVDYLTIHGHDNKTLSAAMKGRGSTQLRLLSVTVLTTLTKTDLEEQGTTLSTDELVEKRALMADAAGLDGVIASGREAKNIRDKTRPGFLIVTPGIRLPLADAGDQTRATTPEQAIFFGASHIVVGRPINASPNPKSAAQTFLDHIARASAKR